MQLLLDKRLLTYFSFHQLKNLLINKRCNLIIFQKLFKVLPNVYNHYKHISIGRIISAAFAGSRKGVQDKSDKRTALLLNSENSVNKCIFGYFFFNTIRNLTSIFIVERYKVKQPSPRQINFPYFDDRVNFPIKKTLKNTKTKN